MTEGSNEGRAERVFAALRRELDRLTEPQPGLYVVSTPIGHLADVTMRALHLLSSADVVLCEDTRITRRLLERYDLTTKLTSYHEHNAASRRPQVMDALSKGAAVVLVSDAGTPLVSDPGYKLVRSALEEGHNVHAVPGPSAVLAGLVVSGLPSDKFWFEGFLPPRLSARQKRVAELAALDATLVFFESPRRIASALDDLAAGLGARDAAMGRELTKRFETVLRGTLPELAERLGGEAPPKGEIVLVVGPPHEQAHAELPQEEIDRRLASLIPRLGTREAAAQLAAETGLKRRDLYQRALRLAHRNG